MHHEAVKPFLNRRLYNDFFAHFFPPFDTERDRHKLFRHLSQIILYESVSKCKIIPKDEARCIANCYADPKIAWGYN